METRLIRDNCPRSNPRVNEFPSLRLHRVHVTISCPCSFAVLCQVNRVDVLGKIDHFWLRQVNHAWRGCCCGRCCSCCSCGRRCRSRLLSCPSSCPSSRFFSCSLGCDPLAPLLKVIYELNDILQAVRHLSWHFRCMATDRTEVEATESLVDAALAERVPAGNGCWLGHSAGTDRAFKQLDECRVRRSSVRDEACRVGLLATSSVRALSLGWLGCARVRAIRCHGEGSD